jgi:hypothetical protein
MDVNEELLAFFKALADQNRLKIIGVLSDHAYFVEEIAELLDISVSTTSHHLARLSKVGLVSAVPEGHYYRYSLNADALRDMSQRILSQDTLPMLGKDVKPMTFDEKVLRTFTDEDGRITAFPKQEKKFAVLIHYVFQAFQPGRIYTGQEMEDILQRFSDDTASLRRAMIEYHLMQRSKDGTQYWVDEKA